MTGIHAPDEAPRQTVSAHDTVAGTAGWDGPTYYGRSQLKQAPFNNWVVGGYIFLAGLSGSSALISAIGALTRGREADDLARRGRYLSLLAPTIGSALLVWDLHTPKRFYNMLRIAKPTSPMSIGTWILMTFGGASLLSAGAQFLGDRAGRGGGAWARRVARAAHVPAAVAGMGLSTYTASLLSATSTPLWAAAPGLLAVRFGSSSVASGAAALSLGERNPQTRRTLDALTLAALASELTAARLAHATYRRTGVSGALDGTWGAVEHTGATLLGNALPLGVLAASLIAGRRRPGAVATAGVAATLMGSLLLRVSTLAAGDKSAAEPGISMRFAQPENLPRSDRA